jgi:hypothetical protein
MTFHLMTSCKFRIIVKSFILLASKVKRLRRGLELLAPLAGPLQYPVYNCNLQPWRNKLTRLSLSETPSQLNLMAKNRAKLEGFKEQKNYFAFSKTLNYRNFCHCVNTSLRLVYIGGLQFRWM